MERYLRVAGPAAIAGMALSILVGVIAGVPFGTVALRGIIGAIVFGGGVVCLVIVAERTLPGLVEDDADGAVPVGNGSHGATMDQPLAAGSKINIVVEDEDDEDFSMDRRTSVSRGDESTATTAERNANGDERDEGRLEPVDGLGSLSDSGISETAPKEESVATGGGAGGVDGVSDDDDEPVEELVEEVEEQAAENAEALMNEAIVEEKYGGRVEIDDTVLDEMPDIGSFSGFFVGPSLTGSDDESPVADPVGSEDGAARRRGGAKKISDDPTIVAKALQTLLSRDEKE